MKVPRLILHLESFLATLCTGRKQHADPEACTPATGVPTCPISGDNLAPIPLKEAGSPIKNDHLIPPGTRATEGGDGNLNLQLNNKRTRIAAILEHIDTPFLAAASLPDDDPQKPHQLKYCGDVFLRRFRDKREKEALDQAVSAYEMALRFLSQEDEMFDQCLCDTSTALLERFQLLGTLSDINDAISKLETAVFRTPDQHPAKAERLSSLCIILARRFQHTEDITDINSSIMNQQRAVELTPEGHKDLPAWLNNLGTSLCNRFKITGSKQDIENAIAYQQKALDIGPVGSPDVPAWLTNLGSSFSHRFELSGDLKDISNAILNEQRSVHLTPEGHPFLPGRINNLAISYARRFKSTGDMLDLSNAISNQQKVIEITPENDLHKSGWLNNLGTMYQRRFKATKDPIDISNAISSQLKAIEVTPEAHSHLPTILNNLGSSYLARFRLEGNLVDISNAVSTHEKAVRLTPSNHPELPSRLNGLGSAYSRRFERTADINDLSNCVSCHERAVELTPQGHVYRSAWSENLGKAYLRRFKHSKDRSDMTLAIAQYRMSATNKFGVPSMRLASAETWARLSRPIDPQQSFEAYAVAVELISQVAGLDQTVQKRHTNLINISYLTTEAAACAFSMSKYHTALEWLEQGRCLVWNQLNQLRTPLDDLFAYDGALARRLLAVSKELEILGSREGGFSSTAEAGNPMENNIKLEAQTQEHISLAQEWDGLLADIRDISQFKDFLRPRRSQDLLENLPDIGFVVVVNVHQNRCDALILHSGSDPVHVSLQKFSYKQAESLRSQLYLCLKDNNVRMREVVDRGVRPYFPAVEAHSIRTVLRELWDCVVLPILASLAQRFQVSFRTRLWWCATGPLAFLPIHAAGIYSEDAKQGSSLPKVAVSSYTPTVSSLVDRAHEQRHGSHNFLLVSQPNTPGLKAIPGTRREAKALAEALQKDSFQTLHLDDREATLDNVKRAMMQHPWVHLACHAVQDTTSPLRSGFHLQDGLLDLSEIMKQQIPNADFAFLSACQTSAGDEKLSEEAVHLAAGMLAAGYRGVVSTMWSIKDNYGPDVAEEFYAYLCAQRAKAGEGKVGLSCAGAAYALDFATRHIREKVKDSEEGLLTWVPYVHFGQ